MFVVENLIQRQERGERKGKEMEEGIGGGFEGLGDLAIHVILSKLDPNETAIVSCVSKRFRDWTSDDYFWSLYSSNDLNLSSPIDPFGSPAPSFKVNSHFFY